MGITYNLKCEKCHYSIDVIEGVGYADSPNSVFYGRSGDPDANWSIAFPDGICEDGEPLLKEYVEDSAICDTVFEMIGKGGCPSTDYGHELYRCKECDSLENHFHFKIVEGHKQYEPSFSCKLCTGNLERIIVGNGRFVVDDDIKKYDEVDGIVHLKCPKCEEEFLKYVQVLFWD